MFEKPARYVDEVFIHCSASDYPEHDDWKVIDAWHRNPPHNYDLIGYHFFITKLGQVQEGRDLERIPAAQLDHNTGTIAICLHGLEEFNEAQFNSLKVLCQLIQSKYDNKLRFRGHKEVDSQRLCPNFDYKKVLNLDQYGFLKPKRKSFWSKLKSLLFFLN